MRGSDGRAGLSAEAGQAALPMLGVLATVLAGTLVLFGFGQALGRAGMPSGLPISRPNVTLA